MSTSDQFVFATCQPGAEPALKAEVAARQPSWRLAFSRPGFVTFKAPAGQTVEPREAPFTFARAHGVCLGKATAKDFSARVKQTLALAQEENFAALHVWERDRTEIGRQGYDPTASGEVHAVSSALQAELKFIGTEATNSAKQSRTSKSLPVGARILDVILVEPDQWWIGAHAANGPATRWPGGIPSLVLPEDAVSRAWLKMNESIAWAGFMPRPRDRWAEIGCAPGGASQALLQMGQRVMGIDPAEVDPRILEDENFTHVRKRGNDVRRREFRDVRFLATDMNLVPRSTLDCVEEIVTHASTQIAGLLLTIKLADWELAAEIPQYLQRVRSWGYLDARARHLAHNRKEICIVAANDRSVYQRPVRKGVAAHRAARRSQRRES